MSIYKEPFKSRAWAFTINNYTDADGANLAAIESVINYMIIGKEGKDTATPHMQGYVKLKNAMSMKALSKKYMPRAHITEARESAAVNKKYCSKEGDFAEYGTLPMDQETKGKKGKEYWDEQLKAIKEKDEEKIDSRLMISHFQSVQQIAAKYAPMPSDAPDVSGLWFYGPSGAGKSRAARERYPDAYLKQKNKWWDGYNGEETVIVDDVDKYDVKMAYDLKVWGDRYAFRAEIKGSSMPIRPNRVIITSQYRINQIWDDVETRDALNRRFTEEEFALSGPAPVFEVFQNCGPKDLMD